MFDVMLFVHQFIVSTVIIFTLFSIIEDLSFNVLNVFNRSINIFNVVTSRWEFICNITTKEKEGKKLFSLVELDECVYLVSFSNVSYFIL